MDKRQLWEEVIPDGEDVVSSERMEKILKFPQKIKFYLEEYERIKIITLRSGARYISEFYTYNGSWKKIEARNGRGNDLSDIHNDAINSLKGTYVTQHS